MSKTTQRLWFILSLCCLNVTLAKPSQAKECKLIRAPFDIEVREPFLYTNVAINHKYVPFMISTGILSSALSISEATRLNLPTYGLKGQVIRGKPDLRFGLNSVIANDVQIAGVKGHNIPFVINYAEDANKKMLDLDLSDDKNSNRELMAIQQSSQLGRELLLNLDLEINAANQEMAYVKFKGCDRPNPAFWTQRDAYQEVKLFSVVDKNDRNLYFLVSINGHTLHAILDSGSAISYIKSVSAQKIGFVEPNPADIPAPLRLDQQYWNKKSSIMSVETLQVGTEVVQNTHLAVVDLSNEGDLVDVAFGMDFLLTHHVLISSSQHYMYFTYNGGRTANGVNVPGHTWRN